MTARVVDNGDGSYDVAYQLPRPGRFVLTVRVGDDVLGAESHYVVQCIEWLSPQRSTLDGVGAVGPLLPGACVRACGAADRLTAAARQAPRRASR